MSTFDGVIREFPGIRVDFFRGINNDPPLACFLSHIHSDHLAGLDIYKGRPIYCSAATRGILLKLQRRASRINFAQGILETEEITYKHQSRRLKSLPLNTPTEIELDPNRTIRVTLLDANHCPGAVMFLFEGNGKAVLYTGDIRSEPCHVDAIIRNPCMLEYVHTQEKCGLKTIDRVYLDTSFTEDVQFQTKSDGLRELLEKVSSYPGDTIFYFSAWTYGYEEVWIALAKALDTKIHVDDYKMKVYESLRVQVGEDDYLHLSPEAPALTGFTCGNSFHSGYLTRDPTVRLHSCEKGSGCPTINKLPTSDVVWITPIVAHLPDKNDMIEAGIGGGIDDLEEKDELLMTPEDLGTWLKRVSQDESLAKKTKELVLNFLRGAISARRPIMLPLIANEDDIKYEDDMVIVLRSLVKASTKGRGNESSSTLPNRIRFPYSRHSSYRELCHLVSVLKPRDIWPCTVDSVRWIREGITIDGLFGEYCSGNTFDHDKHMDEMAAVMKLEEQQESQATTNSHRQSSPVLGHSSPIPNNTDETPLHLNRIGPSKASTAPSHFEGSDASPDTVTRTMVGNKRKFQGFNDEGDVVQRGTPERVTQEVETAHGDDRHLLDSQESSISAGALETRRTAFDFMLRSSNPVPWDGLLSTSNNHSHVEPELGED